MYEFALALGLFFSFIFYFLPSLLAYCLGKENFIAIFVLNFFLGWTFLGWIVCLTWTFVKDKD